MPRLAKGIVIALVILVLLVAGAVAFLESGWARGFVAERASAALGREVTLESWDIDWSSPLHPRIRAGGIRIAGAEWEQAGDMAQIESATARVDVLSLLTGDVVIPEVELTAPKLRLARDAQGRANWDFGGAGEGGGGSSPQIGRLAIDGGQVAYLDAVTGTDVAAEVDTVSGQGGEDRLQVVGSGQYQGQQVAVDARLGSILALRDSENPFPVTGEIRVGKTRIALDGTVGRPLELANMDLGLDIQGESLADLFPIFGFPSPETPPFIVSGRLERSGQVWSFQNFDGRVGDSDLTGAVKLDLGGERPMFTAELTSRQLDFDDLAGFVGAPPGTGEGETASPEQRQQARQEAADDRLIPNFPINLEKLNAADMVVHLRGESVHAPNLPITELDAMLRLEAGRLTAEPVRFGLADGEVAGSIVLDGSGLPAGVETNLKLSELDLAEFFRGSDFAEEMGGTIGGRIKLAGQGANLREVLGSSNGEVGVVMGGGKLSGLVVEAAGIDVAEALGLIVTGDRAVPVRCIVADFQVEDGLMTSRALVIDTTDTLVTGGAAIHLGRERLDVELEAQPKDPSPLAARTGVGIEGPFVDPGITVDTAGILARGAAAVALGALLGPVAALLPLIELGLGEDSPCGALIERTEQRTR